MCGSTWEGRKAPLAYHILYTFTYIKIYKPPKYEWGTRSAPCFAGCNIYGARTPHSAPSIGRATGRPQKRPDTRYTRGGCVLYIYVYRLAFGETPFILVGGAQLSPQIHHRTCGGRQMMAWRVATIYLLRHSHTRLRVAKVRVSFERWMATCLCDVCKIQTARTRDFTCSMRHILH